MIRKMISNQLRMKFIPETKKKVFGLLTGTQFPIRKKPLQKFFSFFLLFWAKIIPKMISDQLRMKFILKTENKCLEC